MTNAESIINKSVIARLAKIAMFFCFISIFGSIYSDGLFSQETGASIAGFLLGYFIYFQESVSILRKHELDKKL